MALLLTRQDVMTVLDMKDCIEVVEKAFLELANETAVLPLRTVIAPSNGISLYMPAYLKEMDALACKVVTVFKNNPEKYDLPVTIGKVLLQNPLNGEVIAIMDGGYLTAVRTGAASGVATKYLARNEKNQVVTIFGAGVQAEMQLQAMMLVRDVSKAFVYDTVEESADRFIDKMGNMLKIDIIKVKNPDEVSEADIICTASSSPIPVFDGTKVKEGTHINCIGSHTPDARELDAEIVKKSKFIGDSKEGCFSEAGDIIIPYKEGIIKEDHFHAELSEIISHKKSARTNNTEITIFKSNGLAIQDAATAKLVYDKAKEAKIGTSIEL